MKPIQMLAVAKQGHPTFTFFLLKVAEKGKEFQAQRQEALQAYWWEGVLFLLYGPVTDNQDCTSHEL